MRWKAYNFLNPSDKATRDTFRFPTTKLPPPVKELDEFENNMLTLVQNIEFNYQSCDFQKRLAKDTTQIKADTKLLVPADKTTNFYRLDSHSYNQLMHTAITKSYKKAPSNTANKIISEEKKIAENLNLSNRIDALVAKNAFVTLKDHNPNFQNHPTCRLINPTKSEIGVISKKILQRINSKILSLPPN